MADNRITRVAAPAYLQGVSIGFRRRDMVADRLAPVIPVAKQSNKYRVFGRNALVQRDVTWHPTTIPNAIEIRWSEGTYFVPLQKLRALVGDHEEANQDPDLDIRATTVEMVTAAIEIAREARAATLFTTSANYPGANVVTKAGGSEWNVVGGEAPLTDLLTLGGTIADSIMRPMSELTVAIPEIVWRQALMRNSAILGTIGLASDRIATTDILAAALGVKEVVLTSSMASAVGPEVAGSDVISGYVPTYLWGDNVWIGLVADGQNEMTPSFARTFNWRAGTNGQERQVRTYRTADEGQEADWIEVEEAKAEAIVYNGAGGLIRNTLSTI